MGETELNQLVYSKNVVEFATVAKEFCNAMENVNELTVQENLQKLQKIMPLLYLKATMLPSNEKVLHDELEKYVTEFDYNVLHQKWLQLLTEHDSYYEVFDPSIQFGEEMVTASISESLMDVYQDLKDFLTAYSLGDEAIMNDALYDCTLHFEEFWGQRLVNVLRAVHMLVYSDTDFDERNINDEVQPGTGSPEWLDKFWGTDSDEEDKNV